MTTTTTDGHVVAICVTCDRQPTTAGSSGSEVRAGTVGLLDADGMTLCRWTVEAPHHFHDWCLDVVAGHDDGQITSGDCTVVSAHTDEALVWARYQPWVNDESSLTGLFTLDEDVVLTLTGGTGC